MAASVETTYATKNEFISDWSARDGKAGAPKNGPGLGDAIDPEKCKAT